MNIGNGKINRREIIEKMIQNMIEMILWEMKLVVIIVMIEIDPQIMIEIKVQLSYHIMNIKGTKKKIEVEKDLLIKTNTKGMMKWVMEIQRVIIIIGIIGIPLQEINQVH